MNSTAKTILTATILTMSSVAFAGMPVTVVSDVPGSLNQVQTMAQWAKQYTQMINQINQMKQQYESMTGTRNLGKIMNDPALRT